MRANIGPVFVERFWARVQKGSGCWEWLAGKTGEGYGSFHIMGRARSAHVVAYELCVGPVPQGLELDHTCRNRGCVNPEHLEPVTTAENLRRSPVTRSALNALKTQCPAGHPYSDGNLIVKPSGKRQCRECNRLWSLRRWRRWQQRKAA